MEKKGSKSSPKDQKQPMAKKGFKSSPKEQIKPQPIEKKVSGSSPKEQKPQPIGKKGSILSLKEKKQPIGKKGSILSLKEKKQPIEKKGSILSPKEQKQPIEKKGSILSPKEQKQPIEKKRSKSSPKEQKELKFSLRCLGDEIVYVDLRCFYLCGRLHNELQNIDIMRKKENIDSRFSYMDARDIGYCPIEIKSPKHIVEMVNKFCIELFEIMKTYTHKDVDLLSHKLEDLNCRFLRNKPLTVLVQLMNAASQLKIKSLMNMVCFDIIDIHAGKFADEILFNMPTFNMPILYRDPHYKFNKLGLWI